MSPNKISSVFCFFLFAFAPAVFAQTNLLPELRKLQEQVLIADMKKKIAEANKGSTAPEPISTQQMLLIEVYGRGKDLIAELQLEDGSRVRVRRGMTLANGWEILDVRPNEVEIAKGKIQKAVPFSIEPTLTAPATFTAQVPPLPRPPTASAAPTAPFPVQPTPQSVASSVPGTQQTYTPPGTVSMPR
jgi:type IV pilus biogenesis protein PilP